MDISVLYIIPNDRIIETVQRVMQRCDVNYPVYYGTMSGALEIAKRMIAQGSRVIVSTGLTALYLRKHLSVPVLELLFTNLANVFVKSLFIDFPIFLGKRAH